MNYRYGPHEQTATGSAVGHAPISRAIYGVITVLAVLQAFEIQPPSAWHGTVVLFGTTLAVALVDTYCESIAEMLAERRRLSRDDLATIGRDVAPVLAGAQGPTLLFLLSAFGLLPVERALSLSQVVAFVLLFGYGWRVGQLLHEHWPRQLASGLIVVAIGGLVVGIQMAFH